MKATNTHIALACTILAAVTCLRSPTDPSPEPLTVSRIVERPGQPDIHYTPTNNQEMLRAIHLARASVSEFIRAIQHPATSARLHAFKMKFTDGGRTEHIWVNHPRFENGRLLGVVANLPEKLRNVSEGNVASTLPDEISDWMYVENDILVGGYSIRLLRSRYSNAQREKFDASIVYVIR